ncbi:MAG: PorT family protein [Bacteroidales bacterium]|nr:PorT family protein [Bacteroidales bacterium]
MNRLIKGILILSFLITSAAVQAQAFKAEIIAGFNKSQVDGDETAGFRKLGFNGGLGVELPIYKNWSLSFETLYNQKGSKLKPQFNDSLDGSYRLRLNYAEVPLMLCYTDRKFMTAGAGVSWGRLVFVDEWRNGYKVDSVTILNGPFSRNDFQIFGDFRFRLYKNLKINARYSYSLQKLATRRIIDSMSGAPNTRDFYNNLWSIRLIYTINESPADKQKKDDIQRR